MRYLLLIAIGVFIPGVAFSQGDGSAALDGPITRFVSLSDFDVSGHKVVIRPETKLRLMWPDGSSVIDGHTASLFVGEHAAVFWGERGAGTKRVDVVQPSIHGADGIATVEAVVPSAGLEVRADGYRIRIGPEAKVGYEKPLAGAGDVKPNTVLKYKGMLQKDGTVLATSATFFEHEVSAEMLEARKTWEYDPSVVPAASRQAGVSRVFRGTDARYFPLHGDAKVQARVEALGEKLIPEYQRNLRTDDSSRIHFRFYVVDVKKISNAYYPLPSGIVLVPYQVVQKLADDSQVAAILADAIACLIEEQPIALPLANGKIATRMAMGAAEAIPLAGLGVSGVQAGSGIAATRQEHRDAEQRARVGLALMRDAGFEEAAAPMAWWELSLDASLPMDASQPPEFAAYLYKAIAEHQAGEVGGLVGKRR